MIEIRKLIIFMFVSLLLIYTYKLLYATRHKNDKSYIFIIMICGLSVLSVATFLDLISGIFRIPYIYISIKACFTLGGILYIIGIILWTDFTKKMLNDLERMATMDSLTGSFNRNGLRKVFETLIKDKKQFYLVVCDLDGTKLINDTLGHIEGDRFICNTCRIMIDSVGQYGRVSRFGGDEFVILLEQNEVLKIENVILNIKEEISRLYPQDNFGVSIGYASFYKEGRAFEELVKVADSRMYEDKKNNHTRYPDPGDKEPARLIDILEYAE
ncbi:GGDEF domain-containing protein [Acetobacterium bakii]|uniref:GGDEF domain-containing protein n=2 Tax=Acetobacterium bakii TaxID=52689 RepID=UPI0006822B49|nr:GGDEF domain-containing protein [Acetobacterium bakii]